MPPLVYIHHISFHYCIGRTSDHPLERIAEHYLTNESFKKKFIEFLSSQIHPAKAGVEASIQNRYDIAIPKLSLGVLVFYPKWQRRFRTTRSFAAIVSTGTERGSAFALD